ncbi:unnamed protein product [Tenebrio molitor]|nr:unnamed protein product [Tenebrio molitor]
MNRPVIIQQVVNSTYLIDTQINYEKEVTQVVMYWVVQNYLWQLCTKMYVATVWVG